MSTPQTFLMASAPTTKYRRRSRPPTRADVHCFSAHIHQIRADASLKGFNHWFALATPSRLACRARTVWQYRSVSSLSGLLPPAPCASRTRLPPASATRCDGPQLDISLHSVIRRLVAHFALAAHPGQSQGRPSISRARSPSRKNGLPNMRSPRRPLSQSADRRSEPGHQPPSNILMPRQGTPLLLLLVRRQRWSQGCVPSPALLSTG